MPSETFAKIVLGSGAMPCRVSRERTAPVTVDAVVGRAGLRPISAEQITWEFGPDFDKRSFPSQESNFADAPASTHRETRMIGVRTAFTCRNAGRSDLVL